MMLSSGVHVLMDALGGRRGAGERFFRRGIDFGLDLRIDGLELCARISHFALDALAQDVERIALALQALELFAVAVLLRVAFIVAAEAAGQRLDECGPLATAR